MLWSFEALVRLARGAVPSALVAPGTWPPASPLAEAWPARAASIGGVECRLGAAGGSPDLAFCVAAASGGRDALGEHLGAVAAARDDAPDAGSRRFLTRWCNPRSLLHGHVPLVWLEFDHAPLLAGTPVPFVTFKIEDAIGAPETRDALVALVAEGLDALGARVDAARIQGLESCFGALPPSGRLGHVAALPHRGSDVVRLIVSVPRSEVQGLVTRLGWHGSPGVLGETLAQVWPNDSTVGVNLDVGDGLGPRVGVELYRPTSARDDPTWRRLLTMLVAIDACTALQQAALEEWPSREDDGRHVGLLRQLLVKLVFEPRKAIQAKAYLAFTPQWQLF